MSIILEPPIEGALPVAPSTEQTRSAVTDYMTELQEELMNFSKARIKLDRLVSDWKTECSKTKERRLKRDVEVDVKALRREGKLDEDETIIPDRVIDTNIQREQPPYINYLKNSRRVAIFTCTSNPDVNTQRLELEFTQGMTYIAWETPHFKTLDGSQTHGWDACEVVYDESKPLHCGIEQIGHDKLFFPGTSLNIQNAPRIVRAFDVTLMELKSFVSTFGFDGDQVGIIIDAKKSGQQESETVRIYKKFCKYEGQVHVGWFSLDHGVSDWLKAPQPLFLGMRHQDEVTKQWVDTPIDQYPVYILPYRETEKPLVTDHKGRVFYDEYKQEAQTAVQSGFVNGITRASNVYAARNQEDGSGSSLKEVQNVKLRGGRILDSPVNFFHLDYPDPMVLKALQWMDVSNDQEMGQPNFAATNRQDSRKTAKEITAAENQQALLNSVQLTLFSTYVRSIYSLVWLIVQSQALQGKIKFLLVKKSIPVQSPFGGPVIDPNTGQAMTQDIWVNDFETIKETYDIRAAGDVDVVQKQEKINQMKQDWPVISQTVLRDAFLAEMLRLQYPDTGEKWATQLETQGSMITGMQGMINALSQIIMGIYKDNPALLQNPQEAEQIKQILAQAQAMSGQMAQQPGGEQTAQ